MELKSKTSNLEVNFSLLKSATEIARTASSRHLKIIELVEQIKGAKTTLLMLRNKVKDLRASKLEKEKLLNDYKARDKVNSHNSESLLQTKAQLNKYKCELKCEYLLIQKKTKEDKAKYDKVVSLYRSEWEKNLELYNSNPMVLELHQLEKENHKLREEILRLKNLIPDTIKRYSDLKETLENQIRQKILLFSQKMVDYAKFVEKERLAREAKRNESTRPITIFGPKKLTGNEVDRREEVIVSADDILDIENSEVPAENLEKQQDEEEFFMMIMMEKLPTETIPANKSGCMKSTMVKPGENFRSQKGTKGLDATALREGSSKNHLNASGVDSRYFDGYKQQQTGQNNREPVHTEKHSIRFMQAENQQPEMQATPTLAPAIKNHKKQKKEVAKTPEVKEKKLEVEEDKNRASQNNSLNHSTDNHEEEKDKLDSEDNDELSKFSDGSALFFRNIPNVSESGDSPASNTNLKGDEDAQFKGFFTMGSSRKSPTPSIFKLF